MPLDVDNPIVNDPFTEPTQHWWKSSNNQPYLREGRRPAGYIPSSPADRNQTALAEQEIIEIETINEIRRRVKEWREQGYPGATRITRELLRHWHSEDRERRLFFCQLEAAETIIWLVEAGPERKQGIEIESGEPFIRYCMKMATGSGKTVVMAMLIAWSVLNKVYNRQDKRFSDAVLVVCPNLTVKERLSVLYPSSEGSYYEKFELVPPEYMQMLTQAKIHITNWHVFEPRDDTNTRSVTKLGRESDRALVNRVLRDLGRKQNILVINDEAHHAYRRHPDALEDTEENREATVWIDGLNSIHSVRGINLCLDFTATPYYIKGSGYEEGLPFPWIVSDFSLMDAIECGIVKIPLIPYEDDRGTERPKYKFLWEEIKDKIPRPRDAKADPSTQPMIKVLTEAEGALTMIASQWKKTLDEWQKEGRDVPPAMIVVCNNTAVSDIISRYIGEKGKLLDELRNDDEMRTLRIDSKLLDEADSRVEGASKADEAERLREIVSTVGKKGKPGEGIRCVVSVSMLSEGWDAQNVTQILGLRAFSSELLCEQVVGRGLRRSNYDDFTVPEYVDVYGVPFEVIPTKKVKGQGPKPPQTTLVRALKERQHLEIRFPRVTGYIFDTRHKVTADIDSQPELEVTPAREPIKVRVKDTFGRSVREEYQDRTEFYKQHRFQSTLFEIAGRITNSLGNQYLFPQVLSVVREYADKKLRFKGDAPKEEIALQKYVDLIEERVAAAIRPESTDNGLRPILDPFRPFGTTHDVLLRTSRECYPVEKSHVSHVVCDSGWERQAAEILDHSEWVVSFVKNERMGFTIPYKYEKEMHYYRPDFIVVIRKEDGSLLNLILEIKGEVDEAVRAKEAGTKRWVDAVNMHGGFGRWGYRICYDPFKLKSILREVASS